MRPILVFRFEPILYEELGLGFFFLSLHALLVGWRIQSPAGIITNNISDLFTIGLLATAKIAITYKKKIKK